MEKLTSRRNETVRRMRRLGAEAAFRRETGEFLCDGTKLLDEALRHGARVTAVFHPEGAPEANVPGAAQYVVPRELLDYVSPLKAAADAVFSVEQPHWAQAAPGRCIVLETIQDPGNLGTILRTANALFVDTVILTGDCADLFHPKTVRATMGAVFRQRVYRMGRDALRDYLRAYGVELYGAALRPGAADLRALDFRERRAAVAIGSEGRGLSEELLSLCGGQLVIPMNGECESLNAAVAAAIIMWELVR